MKTKRRKEKKEKVKGARRRRIGNDKFIISNLQLGWDEASGERC
jgi:hypothetical protein